MTRVVVWPRVVGSMLIWFDDPDVPELLEHSRDCFPIRRISRDLTEAGDDPPLP